MQRRDQQLPPFFFQGEKLICNLRDFRSGRSKCGALQIEHPRGVETQYKKAGVGMKIKRYKQARRVLEFYKRNFQFHEPYQIVGKLGFTLPSP